MPLQFWLQLFLSVMSSKQEPGNVWWPFGKSSIMVQDSLPSLFSMYVHHSRFRSTITKTVSSPAFRRCERLGVSKSLSHRLRKGQGDCQEGCWVLSTCRFVCRVEGKLQCFKLVHRIYIHMDGGLVVVSFGT